MANPKTPKEVEPKEAIPQTPREPITLGKNNTFASNPAKVQLWKPKGIDSTEI